jgi:Putative transposase
MTLVTHEFIRRFLIHVLPAGFHRIRYYGLLTSGKRAENIVDAIKAISPNAAEPQTTNLCPCCGGRMVIIERFERGATPHYRASPPTPAIRIDTS